jgi:hypothetical protein
MGMVKSMVKGVLILGVTIMAFSCSTTGSRFDYSVDGSYEPGTIYADPKIKPSWKGRGLYQENGTIFVVGTAVSERSFAIADKKAKDDAFGKLADYAGAKVAKQSSSTTMVSNDDTNDGKSTNFSESLEENVTTYSEEELSKVRILDSCKYIVESQVANQSSTFVSHILMAIDEDIIDGVQEKNAVLSEGILREIDRRIYDAKSSDDIDFYLRLKDLFTRISI